MVKDRRRHIIMKICRNCGAELEDDAKFCGDCGTRVEVLEMKKEEPKKEKDNQKFVNVDNLFSDKGQTKKVETKKTYPKPIEKKKNMNAQFMSSNELWTSLKKKSRRFQYFNNNNIVKEDTFIEMVSEKIVENQVPAAIERKYVQWDSSKTNTAVYFIKPYIELVNPLTCVVQFSNVGNFSYVEEKVFITPPNLPPYPDDKIVIDPNEKDGAGPFFFGLVIIVLGLALAYVFVGITVMMIVIGAILMILGYMQTMKIQEKIDHNKKCDEQRKKWNKAWEDWENSVFLHSFQEEVNGQVSRIYDSVFASIKQVSDELFNTNKTNEETEVMKMNELEQMINRRKDEYK
ncbi:MAG: zinc-ribbon domain-containing protein [Floccifex sp.]